MKGGCSTQCPVTTQWVSVPLPFRVGPGQLRDFQTDMSQKKIFSCRKLTFLWPKSAQIDFIGSRRSSASKTTATIEGDHTGTLQRKFSLMAPMGIVPYIAEKKVMACSCISIPLEAWFYAPKCSPKTKYPPLGSLSSRNINNLHRSDPVRNPVRRKLSPFLPIDRNGGSFSPILGKKAFKHGPIGNLYPTFPCIAIVSAHPLKPPNGWKIEL